MINDSIFKDNISINIDSNTLKYIIEKKIEKEDGIRKLEQAFKNIMTKLQYTYVTNDVSYVATNKSKTIKITNAIINDLL